MGLPPEITSAALTYARLKVVVTVLARDSCFVFLMTREHKVRSLAQWPFQHHTSTETVIFVERNTPEHEKFKLLVY